MASEDVIELGSSDDEAGSPPKKAKKPQKSISKSKTVQKPILKPVTKPIPKPRLNAMVCIPNKLPDITIKPTKPHLVGIAKKTGTPCKTLGKGISLTKVSNAQVIALKQNGKPIGKQDRKVNTGVLQRPVHFAKNIATNINPYSMPTFNSSQVKMSMITPAKIMTPIKILNPKSLNNLPASITVKRMKGGAKRPASSTVSNNQKKRRIMPKLPSAPVLTVDLDDDEPSGPSTAGLQPQWYLRPEEQKMVTKEEENNKEPESKNFIEITIEDSPMKAKNKRTCEVGTELTITIDDSPVKIHADNEANHSDNDETRNDKVPNSKKKLEYRQDTRDNKTIEIEIVPFETDYTKMDNVEESDVQISQEKETLAKIDESTVKYIHTTKRRGNEAEIEEHEIPETQKFRSEQQSNPKILSANGEFHQVYQNFIDLCLKLEDSEDMRKIVEKKIRGYHRQVSKEYTESEEFIDMVSSKILAMKGSPEKMYLYIKDVVDELNHQRKMVKSQLLPKETKNEEPEKFQFGEDSEFDSKRQRQIRKLEKTLKNLHRAIQKLEEQEVDFDDDEDSVYLLTERYKERMVRVHAKFCQLTNTKLPSEPRILIEPRPGQPSGPAKRLEKWVNKKVPIGTPLPFPDFHDVLRCVREANQEDKLGWNEADIMEEARDLFTRCGKKLQRRRQENEWRVAASRLTLDVDPAEENEDLKKKLDQNGQIACKRETELFNKYADRQSLLKLEAIEIADKEADESPVESEEETVEEVSHLEDKEKRKKRIKRLIQEKSKKVEEENDTESQKINDVEVTEIINDAVKVPKGSKDDVTEVSEKDPLEVESAMAGTEQTSNRDDEDLHSDVDELHLLQQLHFSNEVYSSTIESSDTDSPIDISDTLQSGSENKAAEASDVISIEDSSYSEPELDKVPTNATPETDKQNVKNDGDCKPHKCSPTSTPKVIHSKNDEYAEPVENILLALSDNEVDESKTQKPESNNTDNVSCIQLAISEKTEKSKTLESNNTDSESCTQFASSNIACEESKTQNLKSNRRESHDSLLLVLSDNEAEETRTQNPEFKNTERESIGGTIIEGANCDVGILKPALQNEFVLSDVATEENITLNEERNNTENESCIHLTISDNETEKSKTINFEAKNTERESSTQLALSDVATEESKTHNLKCSSESESCINLNDDSISIGDTIIEETNCEVGIIKSVLQNEA